MQKVLSSYWLYPVVGVILGIFSLSAPAGEPVDLLEAIFLAIGIIAELYLRLVSLIVGAALGALSPFLAPRYAAITNRIGLFLLGFASSMVFLFFR